MLSIKAYIIKILVIGVPMLIGLHYVALELYAVTWVFYSAKLILWGSVFICIPQGLKMIFALRARDPRLWMGIFLACITLSTILGINFRNEPPLDLIRNLANTIVWCSGVFFIPIIICGPIQFAHQYNQSIEWLGYMTAVSIICSMIFPSLARYGFEIIEFADGSRRYFGPLGDSSPFVVLLGLFISLTTRKWFAFVMCVLAVLLSASRSAALVAVFGFIVYGTANYLTGTNISIRRLSILVGVLAFIIAVVLTIPSFNLVFKNLSNRFTTMIEFSDEDRFGGRQNNIEAGWDLWQARPIFGWGIGGNFESVRTDEGAIRIAYSEGVVAGNATNQIIQSGTEGGVLGFAAFTGLLITVVVMGWKQLVRRLARSTESQGIALFCVAAMIGIQTVVYFRDLSMVGYVICLAIGGLIANEQNTYISHNFQVRSSTFPSVGKNNAIYKK